MELADFFREHPRGAVAYSGGVDSSLLVWAAMEYGQDWHAYYVHTAFQPDFELADARKIAFQCRIPFTIIEADILRYSEIAANPPERCYHCKRRLFSFIRRQAAADGYTLLIDGTNASDHEDDRPGMRALRELEVRSPLRECGLTKGDVRELCRAADLFVWNKPAYACLATRIPAGSPLTEEALRKVEYGENRLASLGFQDFRLRLRGDTALLQVPEDQLAYAWERREDIRDLLAPMGLEPALSLLPRKRSD